MTKQPIDKDAFYSRILGFFDQRILAVYKSEPDKYILKTDNLKGRWRRSMMRRRKRLKQWQKMRSTSDLGIVH
jgi:hypothetical protein